MHVAIYMVLALTLASASAVASLFPVAIHLPLPTHRVDTCNHTASAFYCVEFLYNYDGDTINVRVPDVHPLIGEKISVRVAGIDTPELVSSDPCERSVARASRNFVRGMLSRASKIDLLDLKRDKYFRILADVVADGELVADALLANGLAYPYDGGTKRVVDWCERASQATLKSDR